MSGGKREGNTKGKYEYALPFESTIMLTWAFLQVYMDALTQEWFGPLVPLLLPRPPASLNNGRTQQLLRQIGFSEQTAAVPHNFGTIFTTNVF